MCRPGAWPGCDAAAAARRDGAAAADDVDGAGAAASTVASADCDWCWPHPSGVLAAAAEAMATVSWCCCWPAWGCGVCGRGGAIVGSAVRGSGEDDGVVVDDDDGDVVVDDVDFSIIYVGVSVCV